MYNDIDKKFDIATKKALPYLVLAPPAFRKEISELMEALFHQLLQRSEADFETHYAQVNDMIDNRNKFESNLEVRVHNFARRFVSQEETISLMDRQLVKLENRAAKSERKIKSLEKSVKTLHTTKEETLESREETLEEILKSPEEILKSPEEILKSPEDTVLKTHEGYFCGICKTAKLVKHGTRYYKTLGKAVRAYECPMCGTWFKIDENGIEIPTKRNKDILERAEQRRNKR